MNVDHLCHAIGCSTPCPRAHLMCRRHWKLVPPHLQEAVWQAYQPSQEHGGRRVHGRYLAAARRAITAVAALEGTMTAVTIKASLELAERFEKLG